MKIISYTHSKVIAAQRFIEQLRYGSLDVFKYNAQRGNDMIAQLIESGTSAAIGKFGSTELQALRGFIRNSSNSKADIRTKYYRKILMEFSGVYPTDYDTYQKWAIFWIKEVLPEMNIVGTWFNFNESLIVKKYAFNAKPFHSYGLEPYIFQNPWSAMLNGKKVVVVSPFSKTIQIQYLKRSQIWVLNPTILPEMELITVQSPTYPHLVKPGHDNWFQSLNDMKEQISANDFDVLLVGAGAYSLPLCAYAKSLGKIGIHLGGNTQLIFGIMGKRWLVPNSSIDHRYFNDAWIYPLKEETPVGNTKIEGGCYW
jgi:hypothetical protein